MSINKLVTLAAAVSPTIPTVCQGGLLRLGLSRHTPNFKLHLNQQFRSFHSSRLFCTTHFLSDSTNRQPKRFFSSAQPLPQKETVTVYFKVGDKRKVAKAKLGVSFLDVVMENNLDIDGYGACEGTLACSTCHLIFKDEDFKKLKEKPSDEEMDMLDLAYGLQETSRLGCQIIVTKEMDGWEVTVPSGVADARS